MADATVVHIGENSPEYVALLLFRETRVLEGVLTTRKQVLDLYAECLHVVQQPSFRVSKAKREAD